jgi:superfamily II DNA or RNA helicase
LECEDCIAQEIDQLFTFYVKNYAHMPKYKAGLWDGKIHLFKAHTRLLYTGLLTNLIKYCRENKIKIEFDSSMKTFLLNTDTPESKELVAEYNIPLTPYQHQLNAIDKILLKKRKIILSPTSSGKSLILYICVRFLSECGYKVLLVVPTTSLVEQIYKDFQEYGWESEKFCHRIYSGKSKNTDLPVTISTWQSLYTLPKEYFEKFNGVFVDECHLASSASLKTIMENCSMAEYRVGLTGTLDDSKTNEITLNGLFGSIYRTISTKELMDLGHVSTLKINGVLLEHSKEDKEIVSKMDYASEIKTIISNKKRTEFISELACNQKKNTLVLFNRIVHGKEIFDTISEKTEKVVFFIDGTTDVDLRESIRYRTEMENNIIIVASYGVFSTGISIKNLWNVIFAHPYKSRVKNLQSIGRVLRTLNDGTGATLWDIGDNYQYKKKKNVTLNHFIDRFKLYKKEKFDYTIQKVKL